MTFLVILKCPTQILLHMLVVKGFKRVPCKKDLKRVDYFSYACSLETLSRDPSHDVLFFHEEYLIEMETLASMIYFYLFLDLTNSN